MKELGMSLGKIHSLNIKWEAVKKRKFLSRVKKAVKENITEIINKSIL